MTTSEYAMQFHPPIEAPSEVHETCLKVARRIADWNQFDASNAIIRGDIVFQGREVSVKRWSEVHLIRAESYMRLELDMDDDQVSKTMSEYSNIFSLACRSMPPGALEPDPDDPHRVSRARNDALCHTATVAWWAVMGYVRPEVEMLKA